MRSCYYRMLRKYSKIIIILMILAGVLFAYQTVVDYQNEVNRNALRLAETAQAFIPVGMLDKLQAKPEDTALSEYQHIKNSLIKFKQLNKNVEFAYLFTRIDDKLYFLVDSEPSGTDDYSPPGQEFYEATDQDMQPFINGETLLTDPVTDRWGTWISALVPIKDPYSGEVIAEFGIDFSAEERNLGLFLRIIHSLAIVLSVLAVLAILFRLQSKNMDLNDLSIKLRQSEKLFRKVFEQAPIGIAIVKDFTTMSIINPEFSRIVERSQEQMLKTSWVDMTHPEDISADLAQFEKFQAGEIDGYTMEKRYLTPEGTPRWVKMVIASLNMNTEIESKGRDHLCIVEDIHDKKCMEVALRESERNKSALLSNLPGLAYRCKYDREWTMQFLSDGCFALTGYHTEQLLNNNDLSFNELILPEYREILWKEWDKVLSAHQRFRYEYEIITASGEIKWVLEMGQGVYNEDASIEALEGIIIDITETKEQYLQIQYMNNHDFMTGLYNRKYYEEAKVRIDRQNVPPISVIIADINGVRMINDAFGHKEGDQMIVETGKIIKSCCRDEDILARTGGDEFSILLPNTDKKCAYERMRTIVKAFETYNQNITDKARYINVAIGFGIKQTVQKSINVAEKEAEESMHKRKILERKSYHSAILSSVTATMFARSQETEEHAERMSGYCKMIGEKMQLSPKDLSDLELFAMLHDIGKVGIDDRILNKPGKLDEDEWAVMRTHPEIGYRIAMSTPGLESIADYILSHHERWDGNGYPQRQKGKEIPLLSRILAVVDAYDAMTEDRVYRKAMSKEDAVKEIKDKAGTQFDPHVAKIFLESLASTDV